MARQRHVAAHAAAQLQLQLPPMECGWHKSAILG